MGETTGRRAAGEIVAALRARGQAAWLVGGCVRDLLLGRAPEDYDVATAARPEEVAALFPGAQLVGAHFGVALVRHLGAAVEVATFRSDRAYRDGRRPEGVTYETDPRADALRRDFTINALLMDPVTGEVVDYVGGREDLGRGVVRAIGEPAARFQEDHLRLLRAVRFAARLGFVIEPGTFQAMRECRRLIGRVSAERVRDEIERILTEGGARRGFELLGESGLLEETLPEVAAMKGVAQPPEYHPEGDVWTHVMLMLEAMGPAAPALAWGVLLHDVGKPATFRVAERIRFDGHVEVGTRMARGILTRLRASGDLARLVEALVANHMRFSDVHRMKESTLKRFLRLERFDLHLELHRLDCLASHRGLANYELARGRYLALGEEQLRPPRLITGEDLIAAGYTPGPLFRRILERVEDAQLEGRVGTREEALEMMRREFPAGEPLEL